MLSKRVQRLDFGLKILPSIWRNRFIQKTGKGNKWQDRIWHKMSHKANK